MKTSERFNKAISALVKGFFNETLGKGNCSMCAVGNIVGSSSWGNIFMSSDGEQMFFSRESCEYHGGYEKIKLETEKCGYSIKELAKIELTFENNTKLKSYFYDIYDKEQILQDQYNGLMAVVDVLCEIEGIDTKEYKDMFSYKYEDSKLIKV